MTEFQKPSWFQGFNASDVRKALKAAKREESRIMKELQKQIGEWGVETFPTATNRSIAQHLLEEADEVENAAKNQGIGLMEECADVLLLLLHLAHRNGFDLEQAARQKFETIRNAE